MEPTPPTGRPAANAGARVLLGIFIVWQLFFLFAINVLDQGDRDRKKLPPDVPALIEPIAPGWVEKRGQVENLFQSLTEISRQYAQITGQSQSWCLFAPNVSNQCIFPALELHWEEDPQSAPRFARPLAVLAAQHPLQAAALWAPVRRSPLPRLPYHVERTGRHLAGLAAATPLDAAVLAAAVRQTPMPMPPPTELVRSDNEPPDLRRFFRVGRFRLRLYDSAVNLELVPSWEDETYDIMLERWNRETRRYVRNEGAAVSAYLRWRTRAYLAAHPGTPMPAQVILLMRRFRIADPDEAPPYLIGPFVEPVARWQPGDSAPAGFHELEAYNHVTQRFERVAISD